MSSRALLVSQDRRHLFVTHCWLLCCCWYPRLGFLLQFCCIAIVLLKASWLTSLLLASLMLLASLKLPTSLLLLTFRCCWRPCRCWHICCFWHLGLLFPNSACLLCWRSLLLASLPLDLNCSEILHVFVCFFSGIQLLHICKHNGNE